MARLRGIRVIAAAFAAMTIGEVVLLVVKRPSEQAYFSYGVDYAYGLYASGVVAFVALLVAVRLGGRIDDVSHLPLEGVSKETSSGQTLHEPDRHFRPTQALPPAFRVVAGDATRMALDADPFSASEVRPQLEHQGPLLGHVLERLLVLVAVVARLRVVRRDEIHHELPGAVIIS